MRPRSILRFSFQRFPQTLTAAVALLVLFAFIIVAEPAWAADSHSPAVPSASAPGAADPGSRNPVTSKPVPQPNLADVVRPQHSGERPAPTLSAASQMLQRQGPVFIENRGQYDSRVKFLVTGNGANLWLTNEGIVFDFQRPTHKQSPDATEEKREALKPSARGREPFDPRLKSEQSPMERLVFKQKLVSANPNPTIEARDPQPGIYNYFIGSDPDKWRSHVFGYKEVVYRDIWKGIDLKLFANGPNLEEEFIVHPGADASAVQLAYEGIQNLAVGDDGSLKAATAFGDIIETSPHIYQEIGGKAVPVSGKFKVAGNSYTFDVAKRDEHSDLIIDPTIIYSKSAAGRRSGQGTLLYSTYLGGSSGFNCCYGDTEVATGIAVDASGSAYVTGFTSSYDFPTTAGAYLTSNPGGICAFVTKFTPLGDHLRYSTYLCNVNTAVANGIAVDSGGNAFVTGLAGGGFPTTPNALQPNFTGGVFVTKLSALGDALLYSTQFGSSGSGGVPGGYGIAVDSAGRACVAGGVGAGTDFPVTANAFQSSFAGDQAAFLGVLDTTQSGQASLIYSSFLAGSLGDRAQAVAVDAFGMAYITGLADSRDFPVTPGAFQVIFGGGYRDAFVTKFNPNASSGPASVLYSTYLGGDYSDYGYAIAVDSMGNATVGGFTQSDNFPITPGSLPPYVNSSFVTKLNAAGNRLVFSTYWGGTESEVTGAATDMFGDSIVGGYTAGGLVVTPDAFQSTLVGIHHDAYVSKFDAQGGLIYSSYLGGFSDDVANAVAIDAIGDAYVAGYTESPDFPITPGAFQTTINPGGGVGPDDAFVTKFPLGGSGVLSIIGLLPNAGGNAGSVTPQVIGTGFHNGATAKLACGQTNVPGNNVSVSAGGQILTAKFDLTVTAPGICDVVVTNPDLTSATLSNGFRVQQGGAADVRVSKIANGVEPGFNTTYTITANNAGNIDSPNFTVSEFLEPWFTYQFAAPNPSEILTGPVEWPPSKVGDGESYDDLLNWNVPTLPAQSTQPFSYVVQLDQLFPRGMNVTGQACRASAHDVQHCNIEALTCLGSAYILCFPLIGTPPAYGACLIAAFPACYLIRYGCMLEAGAGLLGSFGPCSSVVKPAGYSGDPNYIVGPTGAGAQMWVPGVVPLTYTVQFENEPGATYPVQQAITTDVLNPTLMTPSSLQLATMIVGDRQVPIPSNFVPQAGLDEFFTNLDLRPTQNLFVKIHVQLNPSTGLLTWTFTSIDPTTGLPPTDAGVGFLAPGASVTLFFTVNPKPALPTGTQVTDQATVIFDLNPPENTNTWINTLDNTPPTSRVSALPGTELCTDFNMQWSGNDIGAGIQDFTIYVSDNGGAFTAWQTNTTSTSAVFNGQVGHSYGFYSIARDLVGNVEPGKTSAEATTQVNKGTICGPIGPPTVR